MIKNSTDKKYQKGFTLVEVLVGTALMAIVFTGVFAAYQLGVKVVGLSKNRISATALANSRLETIRNLPYESVGVIGAVLPDAEGDLESVVMQTMSGASYRVQTRVQFIVDPVDGVGAADNCNWDYKKVDVTVSWTGGFAGRVNLSTNISPKNLAQEVQSCQSQPGGILEVSIFNNAGILVPSPSIKVYDPVTNNLIDSALPSGGKFSFPLLVGTYRVEASKNGYSTARTYSTSEVAVPDSGNPSVMKGDLTPMSLSIDQAAEISIDGISPEGQGSFSDSFEDQSLISELNATQVISGQITLAGPPYSGSGYAISNAIAPADLVAWENLMFSDEHLAPSKAVFQILYFNGVSWVLVPDSDLSGNSAGFTDSPVDLAGLNKDTYPQLKIKGVLSSTDSGITSRVNNWQLLWTTNAGVPVPNAAFHLQGAKTIGKDADGEKIYKYSVDQSLDGTGHLDIANAESDSYTFTVNPTSGFSLIGIEPSPQPINANPGGVANVKLFLRAQNAFLITVQNGVTLAPVFSAGVRLSNAGISYDKTQYTDATGKSYFAPLQNGTYNFEISAAGYDNFSGTVVISGQSAQIVNINQQE